MTRSIGRTAGGAGLILLIPVLLTLLAIWHWKPGVYVVAFLIMAGGVYLTFQLFARNLLKNGAYRLAVIIALAAVLILVWMNAAVQGILGDDPANMMYFGVLLVGIGGAVMARLEPRGMSYALWATAFAMVLVPAIAWTIGTPNVAERILPLFGLHALYAMAFAASAILFRKALRRTTR